MMRSLCLSFFAMWLVLGCTDQAVQGRVSKGVIGKGTADAGNLDGGELADGTVVDPDGTVIGPDGTVIGPDGTVIEPDGTVIEPDGTVIGPDGTVIGPDGTVIVADGVIQPDTIAPDIGPIGCQGDGDCPNDQVCGAGGLCKPACPGGCDDNNPCTADTCVKATQQCQHPPIPFATSCQADNSACTFDQCSQGVCVAGPAKLCNDQNPCTADSCSPVTGECVFLQQNGNACEDGNACTLGDLCVGPICVAGAVKLCTDANTCTIDSCNPSNGLCNFDAVGDGTSCTDGNKCTTGDSCNSGKCKGKPLGCQDANDCTDDFCDPGSGCQHPSLDGAACDDGLTCTKGELCTASVCKAPAAQSCDDGNPCTVDGCAQGKGCTHTPSNAACSDGNACTVGDSCKTGTCLGLQLSCDDGNPCTAESCDLAQGCKHVDNGAACNDGNPCTVGDKCTGGSCVAGQGLGCDDKVACTLDTCDPKTGGCQHATQASACDDGIACTLDTCGVQGCVHTLVPNCCGGKQCGAGEACVTYPDTLIPFCAKKCQTGDDCPGSCCWMTYKVKHCLTKVYEAQCCGTTESWQTDTEPYACDVGGIGECTAYPNPNDPKDFTGKFTGCTHTCTKDSECPGSCCGLSTIGTKSCVLPAYKKWYCPF